MRILKKYCALYIVFCMLISTLVFPMNTVYSKDISDYTDLLTVLGVYDKEDYMQLTNETITREELASILSVFYGIKDRTYLAKTEFIDVPEYWASGHILTMVNNGIMSGYADGLFRPQDNVTVLDAMKMFVSMTGYKVIADVNGGYPEGYVYAAYKIGLFDGITITDRNAEITKGQLTKLLFNAINIDLYEARSISNYNENYIALKGKTLLSERLDIYKFEGQITGSNNTSLNYTEAPGKGKVRVGSTLYKYDYDAYSYVGMTVKGYYRQAEDDMIGEILHMEDKHQGENSLEVDAYDIISLTRNVLSYEIDGKIKNANIISEATVLYNGKRESYVALSKLSPKQGSVKLIDQNFDGIYDCVIISSFINYIVSSISNEDGIYFIGSANGKKPLIIDSEDSKVFINIDDRGRRTDLASIKINDVLSVMADSIDFENMQVNKDSKTYTIYRSDMNLSGVYTSLIDDGIIIVNDVEYQIAWDYDYLNNPLVLGESYTFYLNHLGQIIYSDMLQNDMRYGILQNYSLKNKLGTSCTLRIFDQSGSFVIHELESKANIDGNKQKNVNDSVKYLKNSSYEFTTVANINLEHSDVWQLIRYKTNSSKKIDIIDTVIPDKVATETELTYSGRTNPSAYNYQANGVIYSPPNTAQNLPALSFYVSDTAVSFQLASDLNNTDSYALYPKSLYRSQNYDIKIFNSGIMNTPKALICFRDIKNIDIQTYPDVMCIEEIYQKMDANGIVGTYLSGVHIGDGTKMEICLSSEDVYVNSGAQPGDIIQWAAISGKEVETLRVAVSKNGGGYCISTAATTKSQGGGFNYGTRFSWGKAIAADATTLCQRFEGIENDLYDYTETNLTNKVKFVYIFNSKTNKLEPASILDVRTVENYGEAEADNLACIYKNNIMTGVVIYR